MSSPFYIAATISLGIFVDSLSYSIVLPFYPDLVLSIGGSSQDVGIILSFFSTGLILGSLLFGVLSDRSGVRRPLMLAGLSLLILSTLLMVFIRNYWSLCLGRFLQGLASGSVWVLGMALVADTCSEKDLGLTMATVFTGCIAGQLTGPLIGGILFETQSYLPYVVVIGVATVDLIMRIFLVEPEPKKCEVVASGRTTREIIRALARNKSLWILLALNCICGIVIGSIEVVFTLQLLKVYLLTSAKAGFCFLALAIPQAVTNPLGGWAYDRVGYRMVIIPGLVATSGMFFLLLLVLSLPYFLTVFGIMSSIAMFSFSPILPEIAKTVDLDSYGVSYGITKCAFAIGLLFGSAVGAIVFQDFGLGVYCMGMGVMMLLAIPLVCLDRSIKTGLGRNGKLKKRLSYK